jgi:cytochrome c peroxidase
MGQKTVGDAAAAVAKVPEYAEAFERVFGRAPNATDLLRAIAAYERTLVSFGSPFDRFIAGETSAIGDDAKRGWELFNTRGRCNLCHALSSKVRDPSTFTDNDFHNIGIGIIRHNVVPLARKAEAEIESGNVKQIDDAAILSDLSVLGRFLLTKKEPDIAAFKTPDIRNVLMTAPYFHDGSQLTLWDIVDHYNKGDGLKNPWLDEDIRPLALSEGDIDDLVAFMASLTSPEYADLGRSELERQRAIAQKSRPQRDTKRAFEPKVPNPPSPFSH